MPRARTTNVRDLRKNNRSRALVEMYMNGPMTRQEIGDSAGFSPATVSNLVNDLIDQGVIVEVGVEDSDGGRPRTLLAVDPDFGYVVGVDVGEQGTLVELFDLGMKALASHTMTHSSAVLDPDESVDMVREGLDRVIARSGVDEGLIIGVGVGVPGLVDHGGGDAVVHAQTVGWDGVPLGRMLRRGTALPLLIENGAKTMGQAEKWFGAARHVDNAVIVLLGTGVGTSIITEGQLYRGLSSSAGEWGHTTITLDGRPCRCGAAGCLEAYVGAEALLTRYNELRRRPADGQGTDEAVARLQAIVAAGATDRSATRLLGETANYLGAGLANLINLFNPERIVIGGWLGQLLTDRLLPDIIEVASRHALTLPFSQVSIVPAELGTDAVALGAATLPINQFLAAGAVPAQRRIERVRRDGAARSAG